MAAQNSTTYYQSLLAPSSLLILATLLAFLYVAYLRALPKPLAGIPYNEDSAKRIWGDMPIFREMEKAGIRPRLFWSQLAQRLQSPVTQFFMGPFYKPMVVLADWREAQDLLLRRSKNLERGTINNSIWSPVAPEHFISMNSSDPRYKSARDLGRDLMTPTFLNTVSAPEIYDKTSKFIELWDFKARVAEGRPFEAAEDLNFLTNDIILAAALGLDDSLSDTTQQLAGLRAKAMPKPPCSSDACFPFPVMQGSEALWTSKTLTEGVGRSATQPSPRLYHFFNNLTPQVRKAYKAKDKILRTAINGAAQRVEKGEINVRNAVDLMVSREITAARKAGQSPELNSLRMHDQLFGYILGGQDTSHSVLTFLVKWLGARQNEQKALRDNLRSMHSTACNAGRPPTTEEIIKTQVPYLDAFIEEVIRMSAPIIVVTTVATADMILLGHFIPKDTVIWSLISGPTTTEPGFKIPEAERSESSQKHNEGIADWADSAYAPDEFHPERWLKKRDETGEMSFDSKAGPFLGFSSGPRACWGKRLAYLELRIVITLLTWNFEFLPLPDEMNGFEAYDLLLAKPKSCFVRLKSNLKD